MSNRSCQSGESVALKQFDKTRVLSRATPLGQQTLLHTLTTSRHEVTLELLLVTKAGGEPAAAADNRTVLTTSFRRVHCARATANRQHCYRPVQALAYFMRVSVLAIHADGSESVRGGLDERATPRPREELRPVCGLIPAPRAHARPERRMHCRLHCRGRHLDVRAAGRVWSSGSVAKEQLALTVLLVDRP